MTTEEEKIEKAIEWRQKIRVGVIPSSQVYDVIRKVRGLTSPDITLKDVIETESILLAYTMSCHTAYPLNVISNMQTLLYIQELQRGSIYKEEVDSLLKKIKKEGSGYTFFDFHNDFGGDTLYARLHTLRNLSIPDNPIPVDIENEISQLNTRINTISAINQDLKQQLDQKETTIKQLQTQLALLSSSTIPPEYTFNVPKSSQKDAVEEIIKKLTKLKTQLEIQTGKTQGLEAEAQADLSCIPRIIKYTTETCPDPYEFIESVPTELKFLAFSVTAKSLYTSSPSS